MRHRPEERGGRHRGVEIPRDEPEEGPRLLLVPEVVVVVAAGGGVLLVAVERGRAVDVVDRVVHRHEPRQVDRIGEGGQPGRQPLRRRRRGQRPRERRDPVVGRGVVVVLQPRGEVALLVADRPDLFVDVAVAPAFEAIRGQAAVDLLDHRIEPVRLPVHPHHRPTGVRRDDAHLSVRGRTRADHASCSDRRSWSGS